MLTPETAGRKDETYLLEVAQRLFGDTLIGLARADCVVRQICHGSSALGWYTLILTDEGPPSGPSMRLLQAEFPDLQLLDLTLQEALALPVHARWVLAKAPLVAWASSVARLSPPDDGLRQALCWTICQAGHLLRSYLLRSASAKSQSWAVRQMGWAVRHLAHLLRECATYAQTADADRWARCLASDLKTEEVAWADDLAMAWRDRSQALLSNRQEYQRTALRLHDVVEGAATVLARAAPWRQVIAEKLSAPSAAAEWSAAIAALTQDVEATFAGNLRALYLQGSTARGEADAASDLDSILVVDRLDREVMESLGRLVGRHVNLSVSSLSTADLAITLPFAHDVMGTGTRRLAGDIVVRAASVESDAAQAHRSEALRHHTAALSAVARFYINTRRYGERACFMLELMTKLAGHICMRLAAANFTNSNLLTREKYLPVFRKIPWAQDMAERVATYRLVESAARSALMAGDSAVLDDGFAAILAFSAQLREHNFLRREW